MILLHYKERLKSPASQLFTQPFIRAQSKENIKDPRVNIRVTGLCEGISPVTHKFPAQRASNSEKSSIWLRHHVGVVFFVVVLSGCI